MGHKMQHAGVARATWCEPGFRHIEDVEWVKGHQAETNRSRDKLGNDLADHYAGEGRRQHLMPSRAQRIEAETLAARFKQLLVLAGCRLLSGCKMLHPLRCQRGRSRALRGEG